MGITTLPPEIVQAIISFLDLDNIKALRLGSRDLAAITLGPRFLGFIREPTLDVSLNSLRSLHALACNSVLRGRVHNLTLLSTVFDCSEQERKLKEGIYWADESEDEFSEPVRKEYSQEELSLFQSQVDWVKEQEKNRQEESVDEMTSLLQSIFTRFGHLEAIILDAVIMKGHGLKDPYGSRPLWVPLCARASTVFNMILTSIDAALIPLTRPSKLFTKAADPL
ncbi:hypothetical protein N7462_000724 [Penicillium macrosclerotiorum]|uniref:uncharacterized protein n=1 Tax=Penicillium macrosclerotiorum TaxID=303699 RepID=UPI00254764E9|nr:uncharacterized protein N7462_000724 [Penicillium macrosclerotiorum]KAJ5698719.1 hypothetical protein N7462_000724 [Penicillium macrosclerotiorum]